MYPGMVPLRPSCQFLARVFRGKGLRNTGKVVGGQSADWDSEAGWATRSLIWGEIVRNAFTDWARTAAAQRLHRTYRHSTPRSLLPNPRFLVSNSALSCEKA